jgi:hypothetical protein
MRPTYSGKDRIMRYLILLSLCTLALLFLPVQPSFGQDQNGSGVAGDPFVKKSQGPEFKLPSAAKTKNGRYQGYDYQRASRIFDQLGVRHDARPYSQLQKNQAFGSETEYEREQGGRDAMQEFNEIESDLLKRKEKEE